MMIVDINPSESDNDKMIVMTMIMILLPSDSWTVCTQYYYNKYHLYNNKFVVRVVKGKLPATHLLLLVLLLIISVPEIARPGHGQPSQAEHSGHLGVLFQKCLSRPGSNDRRKGRPYYRTRYLVSNTQTTI